MGVSTSGRPDRHDLHVASDDAQNSPGVLQKGLNLELSGSLFGGEAACSSPSKPRHSTLLKVFWFILDRRSRNMSVRGTHSMRERLAD